jgi:hypothetical protein
MDRGYRYSPDAVDTAAARILQDIGGRFDITEKYWTDDPRNTAQAVLEVFLHAGVVVLPEGN